MVKLRQLNLFTQGFVFNSDPTKKIWWFIKHACDYPKAPLQAITEHIGDINIGRNIPYIYLSNVPLRYNCDEFPEHHPRWRSIASSDTYSPDFSVYINLWRSAPTDFILRRTPGLIIPGRGSLLRFTVVPSYRTTNSKDDTPMFTPGRICDLLQHFKLRLAKSTDLITKAARPGVEGFLDTVISETATRKGNVVYNNYY